MLRSRNVYVVDDDTSVRTSFFFAMTTLGYIVRPFSGGQEFLDHASALKSGCVLLDMRMPDVDGIQVIEMLGDRIASLPVVLMTGHGDISMAVRAMKLGASDFLEKPFEEAQMLEAVERVFVMLEERTNTSDSRLAAQQTLETLTRRESEVLNGLAAGLSNKVIAFKLGLSVRTVEMHRSSMMQRLGVSSLPKALEISFIAAGVARETTIS